MESNQQQLFAIIDDITGTKASSAALPSYEDASLLAQRFSDYFSGKISKLREQLSQLSCTETSVEPMLKCSLVEFSFATEESLTKVIVSMKNKSCVLDPMPTELLKFCLPNLIKYLVNIVNKSYTTGNVPNLYKKAVIRPLLKKIGLDINNLSNYRPVSNLVF